MIKQTALILLSVFICLTSNLYGDTIVEPLYIWNKALMPKLEPVIYPTGKYQIMNIFDFPADNAIATTREPGNNAITLIGFDEKNLKVTYKTIAKDFTGSVGGGKQRYLPVFSEDTIGYTQTRGFILLDLKTKKCDYHVIYSGFELHIVNVGVLDAEKKIFVFELFPSSHEMNSIMRIMQFSDNGAEILGEKEVARSTYLNYTKNTVFLIRGNDLKAYDIHFKEIDHPFSRKFEQEKNRFADVDNFLIHPDLPFGVFTEYSKEINEAWMISWCDPANPVLQKLFNQGVDFYKFSYDGKWLFGIGEQIVIMPVDPELPHFLGAPILLGENPVYPSGATTTKAITRNPAGLVAPEWKRDSKGKKVGFLKKWDFTEAEKLIEK